MDQIHLPLAWCASTLIDKNFLQPSQGPADYVSCEDILAWYGGDLHLYSHIFSARGPTRASCIHRLLFNLTHVTQWILFVYVVKRSFEHTIDRTHKTCWILGWFCTNLTASHMNNYTGPCKCNGYTQEGKQPGTQKGECLSEQFCGKWWATQASGVSSSYRIDLM